jgi:GNAT superfamily N-acetyltransferase
LFDIRTGVLENTQTSAGLGVTPESVRRMLQTTSRAWLVEVNGTPVAFSMANAADRTIFAMFVRPGHEGCGFGRALMDRAEAWLFESGADEIWLDTGSDPALRAHGFYQRLGWHRTEIRHDDQVRYVRRREEARAQTAS